MLGQEHVGALIGAWTWLWRLFAGTDLLLQLLVGVLLLLGRRGHGGVHGGVCLVLEIELLLNGRRGVVHLRRGWQRGILLETR